jgi:4-hydroxy-L-threonine phosphate dehydrogenase PdxA
MSGWLGITLGDPTGIGPEVTLKALQILSRHPDDFQYLLLGDVTLLKEQNERFGINLPLAPSSQSHAEHPDSAQTKFFFEQAGPKLSKSAAPGSSVSAESALAALTAGARPAPSASQ